MGAIFADDISKCIFLNANDRILIQISLKFVPRSPIDNKPALVQVMAWHRIGDKPLPEPMMTQFTNAYMEHKGGDELTFVMLDSAWETWENICIIYGFLTFEMQQVDARASAVMVLT